MADTYLIVDLEKSNKSLRKIMQMESQIQALSEQVKTGKIAYEEAEASKKKKKKLAEMGRAVRFDERKLQGCKENKYDFGMKNMKGKQYLAVNNQAELDAALEVIDIITELGLPEGQTWKPLPPAPSPPAAASGDDDEVAPAAEED